MSVIKHHLEEIIFMTSKEWEQKLKTERIIEALETRNQKYILKSVVESLGTKGFDIKVYKDFDFKNIFKFLEFENIKLKTNENLLKLLSQCDLLVFCLLKAFWKRGKRFKTIKNNIEILEFKKIMKNQFRIPRQTVENSLKKFGELGLIEIDFKKIKIKKFNLILNQKNQPGFVVKFKDNLLFCLLAFGREFAKKVMLLKWLKKQNNKKKALTIKIKKADEKILSNNLFNSSKKNENASRIKKAITQILFIFANKKYEDVFCVKYKFEKSVIKRFRTFYDKLDRIQFC